MGIIVESSASRLAWRSSFSRVVSSLSTTEPSLSPSCLTSSLSSSPEEEEDEEDSESLSSGPADERGLRRPLRKDWMPEPSSWRPSMGPIKSCLTPVSLGEKVATLGGKLMPRAGRTKVAIAPGVGAEWTLSIPCPSGREGEEGDKLSLPNRFGSSPSRPKSLGNDTRRPRFVSTHGPATNPPDTGNRRAVKVSIIDPLLTTGSSKKG